MRYPLFVDLDPPQTQPVDALIEHTGSSPIPDDSELEPNYSPSSLTIGRAAVALVHDESQKAKTLLRRAKAEIRLEKQPLMVNGMDLRAIQADMQTTVIEMMWHRKNLPEVRRLREQLHAQTINGLVRAMSFALSGSKRARLDRSIGFINELTLVGIFNRYAHPWCVCVPALEHHETGSTHALNYDALLIVTSSHTDHWRAHKLQAKSSTKKARNERENYSSDIFIISAQASLGYGHLEGEPQFPIAQKLVAEWHDRLDDEGIAVLDGITAKLLTDIGTGVQPSGKLATK